MKINVPAQAGQKDLAIAREREKLEAITPEEFHKKTNDLRTLSDVTQFAKSLVAPLLQKMLEAEMDHHLG